MAVDITTYRAVIGLFNITTFSPKSKLKRNNFQEVLVEMFYKMMMLYLYNFKLVTLLMFFIDYVTMENDLSIETYLLEMTCLTTLWGFIGVTCAVYATLSMLSMALLGCVLLVITYKLSKMLTGAWWVAILMFFRLLTFLHHTKFIPDGKIRILKGVIILVGLSQLLYSLGPGCIHDLIIILSNDVEKNPGDKMKFMTCNINQGIAQGMASPRFVDLCITTKQLGADFVALSEAGKNLNLSELGIDGYHAPLYTTVHQHGRGLLLYIKEDIPFKVRTDLTPDLEMCWVEIVVSRKRLLLGSGYRSPCNEMQLNSSIDNFNSKLKAGLDKAVSEKRYDVIAYTGDFNSRSTLFYPLDRDTYAGNALYNTNSQLGFEQLIHEPTRITTTSKTCIDLAFTNTPGFVYSSEVLPPVGGSDHCATLLIFDLDTLVPGTASNKKTWKYSDCDINVLNTSIAEVDWLGLFAENNVNTITLEFCSTLLNVFSQCIPTKIRKIKKKDMPWMTEEIRRALNKRDKLYKKFMRDNTEVNKNLYNLQVNSVRQLITQRKQFCETETLVELENHSNSTKYYWNVIKSLLGKKFVSGIPTLYQDGLSSVFSSDDEKSRAFLSIYTNKFHHDLNFDCGLPCFIGRTACSLDYIITDYKEVRELLLELDPSKSEGPDGITAMMLRMAAPALARPLSLLFNRILNDQIFPDCWKEGTIIPIYKNKGSRGDINMYRPVTLLNVLSKVLERIIHKRMLAHLLKNNLLFVNQSGFLPGHGTDFQIISIVDYISQAFEENCEVRGVFLDIESAFDKVPHKLLLHKIKAYGFGPEVMNLLTSYLANRKVRTKVNGHVSEWSRTNFINSGVPQGSILGPLMFLIYINDLPEVIKAKTYIYADDTSIYLKVPRNSSISESHRKLQTDLNNIYLWSSKWKLTFKPSKTREVIFCKNEHRDHPKLSLNNDEIIRVHCHTHLGVVLDESLSWKEHICYVREKSDRMLNPLSALKYKVSSKHLELMYKSFVLSVLEYGSIFYDSAADCYLEGLDRVHYRAALIVAGTIQGTSATKLFKTLGWKSLKSRRKDRKAIFMHKVKLEKVPTYVSSIYGNLINQSTRSNIRDRREFRLPPGLSAKYRKSPAISALVEWTNLSAHVRTSPTLNTFKNRVEKATYSMGRKCILTPRLTLPRSAEIKINKLRSDLAVKVDFNRHNFPNSEDVTCQCGFHRQTKVHLLLDCPVTANARQQYVAGLHALNDFDATSQYVRKSKIKKVELILYGDKNLPDNTNIKLMHLLATYVDQIEYI